MFETSRLRIRPFRASDMHAFIGWHTRPANREFKWDGPLTAKEALRDFEAILRASDIGQATYSAIDLLGFGEPIGQIGLFPVDDRHEIALAYLIDQPHWGFGYATEASRALIAASWNRHPDRLIVAVIPAQHVASERVAAKLGMRPRHREFRNGMPVRRWEVQPGDGVSE